MTNICSSRRTDLALVRVTGTDARRFLHAQTTQRIDDLPPDQTRLAAWLSPAGRVQALFDVVPDQASFWLVTQADNADWVGEGLARYVLRADVRLEVAADRQVYSLVGDATAWLTRVGVGLGPRGLAQHEGSLWFRVSDELINVIGPPAELEQTLADLPTVDADVAIVHEIAAGRADLPAVLRDRYVAQMLNLDTLDAISFTKGCYPGQEIVARTQNLGRVKRRLARFGATDGERPVPGDEIVDAAARPAGEVVRAARSDGGYEILAVVRLEALGGSLTLARGVRVLERLPLPGEN